MLLGLFKKKKKDLAHTHSQTREYKFTWYEIGESNPFNKKVLDIRSLTQYMLSWTKDESVARSFLKLRHSVGQELINAEIYGSKNIEVDLVYPHSGSKIEGAAYKAKCMEDKWDIYGWNGIIYFARSWTGEIIYKAHIKVSDTNFSIYKIEYQPDDYNAQDISFVKNNVHFLIKSLAFGNIYPHKVPVTLSEKDIALYSFNLFGHNCWYATFDEILDTIVKIP
jgi:hypothetical protein